MTLSCSADLDLAQLMTCTMYSTALWWDQWLTSQTIIWSTLERPGYINVVDIENEGVEDMLGTWLVYGLLWILLNVEPREIYPKRNNDQWGET